MEDLRKEWMPAAEKRARLQLVVSEIAKKEGIAIEDSDLDAEIAKMAEERKVAPAELKESLAKNNLDGLHAQQPPHGQALRLPAVENRRSARRKRGKYWTFSRGIRYH